MSILYVGRKKFPTNRFAGNFCPKINPCKKFNSICENFQNVQSFP